MTTAASTSQNASSTLMAAGGAGVGATTATLLTMTPSSSAVRALAMEYKSLQEEPVEGFRVKLMNDDNLFEWEVAIFGPPDTLYQGGYFKAHMKFPHDYPYSPPSIRFLTKVWHPNVYENGDLCISILHPPVDDPQSGELPCERWNPTQNVRTILLSVISLLNEPNTYSPANVDASVMYRRWRDSQVSEVIPSIVSIKVSILHLGQGQRVSEHHTKTGAGCQCGGQARGHCCTYDAGGLLSKTDGEAQQRVWARCKFL